MVGLITSNDVLKNFRIVWVEFGPAVALSCVASMFRSKRVTFLELACKHALVHDRKSAE